MLEPNSDPVLWVLAAISTHTESAADLCGEIIIVTPVTICKFDPEFSPEGAEV
ncbi:MAG TPA: hypothetical protein VEZ90_00205 [Blastocatellia bacterium]|nr:hypothetical protein [Blastocatellia bacterium]